MYSYERGVCQHALVNRKRKRSRDRGCCSHTRAMIQSYPSTERTTPPILAHVHLDCLLSFLIQQARERRYMRPEPTRQYGGGGGSGILAELRQAPTRGTWEELGERTRQGQGVAAPMIFPSCIYRIGGRGGHPKPI